MKYVSTRGAAPEAQFEEVLLTGLAPDGGLYAPLEWPTLTTAEITALREKSYPEAAANIVARFAGDSFSEARLLELANAAYGDFAASDTAPLTSLGGSDHILELYHGPTLAFKDFAMQLLGRLFDDVLAERNQRLTIIAATSGDTGAAAIEALRPCAHVNIVVLHPEGRVTDVQRRMMTSVDAPNVLNIAVGGAFDDCQAIVKSLFADREFVEQVSLSGVNSINWARVAAQTVYYFTARAALPTNCGAVNFVVPTGNFGDVFAGYVAKRMGLDIEKLVVATNANDILHRALTTGDYTPGNVQPTASPSMDIQVASNFERLLFEVMERNGNALRSRMQKFAADNTLALTDGERAEISKDFHSYAASEKETVGEIKRHFEETGALIDPHTAVARCAARALRDNNTLSGEVVTLSTAHPAKFPDVIQTVTGQMPQLPDHYATLFEQEEHMIRLSNDEGAIKNAILERFRTKP